MKKIIITAGVVALASWGIYTNSQALGFINLFAKPLSAEAQQAIADAKAVADKLELQAKLNSLQADINRQQADATRKAEQAYQSQPEILTATLKGINAHYLALFNTEAEALKNGAPIPDSTPPVPSMVANANPSGLIGNSDGETLSHAPKVADVTQLKKKAQPNGLVKLAKPLEIKR